MKTSQVSTGLPWESGVAVARRTKAKEGESSLGNFILMLPAGLLGLVIGTFPFSLPVLYAIVLLFL